DIQAFWGIRATVTLCPVARPDNARGFVNHYLRPAASFFAQALYAGTAGPAQVAAFETAVDAGPEAIFVHRPAAMCPALRTPTALAFDLPRRRRHRPREGGAPARAATLLAGKVPVLPAGARPRVRGATRDQARPQVFRVLRCRS